MGCRWRLRGNPGTWSWTVGAPGRVPGALLFSRDPPRLLAGGGGSSEWRDAWLIRIGQRLGERDVPGVDLARPSHQLALGLCWAGVRASLVVG